MSEQNSTPDPLREFAERARKAQEAVNALGAGKPQPSGLPQSEHGGLHPEVRARITAAEAVLGDYRRDYDAWLAGNGAYIDHQERLAAELRGLLETIERLGR